MTKYDPSEALQQLQEKLVQQQAAHERNPNFRCQGPQYANRCETWARRDLWTLLEAANLLCGTDPERPVNPNGEEHQALNRRIQEVRILLERADIPKQGMLKKQLPAKTVMHWAKKKGLDLPSDLLSAMGHKPVEDKPVHGNALKNAEKRQAVLGAAVAALVKYPAQCKDRGGKPTGRQIATVLEQHQANLFPEGLAPFSVRTMADLINTYLPK
ncbi:hypothetical protein [Thiohalobacter thiocyanaticus]|uniref:Uncharacterized protein n=1 Tax=Thiohalobacter thiocyanaticus TaxID=585455 RepID=A0A426QL15_9GAMM|nr:hypothetical protein [Thiohalobacter thiocyanaticus]RRQ22448.1 hypothetical protein D6C00_11180 [Thiohalobacter thiocyanaticus]